MVRALRCHLHKGDRDLDCHTRKGFFRGKLEEKEKKALITSTMSGRDPSGSQLNALG